MVNLKQMGRKQPNPSSNELINPSVYLKLVPLQALFSYLNTEKVAVIKKTNTAIINISGRQKMLSQRIAFYSLRLVHCQDVKEQEKLRQELLNIIDLMEVSHRGLILGDWSMNLSGEMSPEVKKIYYQAPFFLDKKVSNYLYSARQLVQTDSKDLRQNNPDLQYILDAASKDLFETLDVAVTQYQKEKKALDLEIELYQQELDHQNFTTAALAVSQANELKATLEELKTAQLQLIQAEKMASLGQLLAGIGHEIINPLNFIIGNIDYLEQYSRDLLELVEIYGEEYPQASVNIKELSELLDVDCIKDDFPKIVHSLRLGSERIKEIIDNLRVFSHQENARSNLANIHQCLDTSLSILKHRLKNSSEIKVIKNYGDLPLVDCYSGEVTQVFLNIINNAIDELESSGIITIVTSANVSENYVSIGIKDNGKGINPGLQSKIFDPFFTTKPVGKGTGLGLSISYQIIVKRHYGSIKCISQPQQGTEFLITIPIKLIPPPYQRRNYF